MKKLQIKELEKASKLINDAKSMLEEARDIIEPIRDAEQEKFDNMSERAKEGEKGQQTEGNASNLDSAVEALGSAEESAEEAANYCDDIVNQ
ncbi:MAG: hypothetical protein JWQ09_5829 [Segetibacter sp.]|nr:hypothetical protein [Segetibacter sp.]